MFCEELEYCNEGQGHSKGHNVNVCPDDIFLTNKHFVTKLGIVMHRHEPECPAERLVCFFQG